MDSYKDPSGSKDNNDLPVYFLIILLPFFILYWMVPFLGDLRISHDYPVLIKEQLELLFSLKTGSFPLYVPGYHLGHSSTALTMGQLYHPISHIAALLPGYWAGKALELNTFVRLLTLGAAQLALFSFLRQMRVSTVFSFVISFVTVFNLRMLEAMRYGASLEAFTGHLLLCALMGRYCIRPSGWALPVTITALTYMIVCSGHPPMMFYGFAGAILFSAVIPFFLSEMLPDRGFDLKAASVFWRNTAACMITGVLLSAAYVIPLKFEFVDANVSYAKAGFQPTMGQDTLAGALNNFFMPYSASLLDSFGGSSVILVALLLPLLKLFRVSIPRVVWTVWGALIFTLLYIMGPNTPVFKIVWTIVPIIQSMGQVGRIAIIIPTIIMLLMAWLARRDAEPVVLRGSFSMTPAGILGAVSVLIIPLYLVFLYLVKPEVGHFNPFSIRDIPMFIALATVFFGLLSLAAITAADIYPRLARIGGAVLCVAVCIQVGTVLHYGMFIEHKRDEPTFERIMEMKRENLDYAFHENPNASHHAVTDHLFRSFMEPSLGRLFTNVTPVADQDEGYALMQKERLPQQIFIEDFDAARAGRINRGAADMKEGSVELVYNSFNNLRFMVESEAPALFGLSFPNTGHWKALVNGKDAPVFRGNGILNVVEVPAGETVVEFRYWSRAFCWGVLISCVTFILMGLHVGFYALKGYARVMCMLLALVVGAGSGALWYRSLYSGENLGTVYKWTYTAPGQAVNIAYGKQTSLYTVPTLSFMHWHSSNIVDGDRAPGSGIPLGTFNSKEVVVDLNKSEKIGSIVLYGDIAASPDLAVSEDGNNWETVTASSMAKSGGSPLRITFDAPVTGRYIKARSMEQELYMDELEVYRAL